MEQDWFVDTPINYKINNVYSFLSKWQLKYQIEFVFMLYIVNEAYNIN